MKPSTLCLLTLCIACGDKEEGDTSTTSAEPATLCEKLEDAFDTCMQVKEEAGIEGLGWLSCNDSMTDELIECMTNSYLNADCSSEEGLEDLGDELDACIGW